MKLQDIVARTIKVNNRFKAHFGKQGRAMSLVSEVGELMDAMLEYEGGKEKGDRDSKSKEEVADALCDILYNVFVLSNHYEINLTEEYNKMIDEVEKRFEKGEFVEG